MSSTVLHPQAPVVEDQRQADRSGRGCEACPQAVAALTSIVQQRRRVGSPRFRRAPPSASAAAGRRSVSRTMRAPAGFPSSPEQCVRLELELDDEAGQAPRRLLQRQHDAAPAVAVERPRDAPAWPRGAREGTALGHEAGLRAGPLEAEDDDEAAADGAALVAASSAGVPTCSRLHRGVIRTGTACRSF
ncbi:hypothetical protein C2845_PM13G02410 [Panicum miliaceum]|uniref:Uncharacterized protein n=1 Tax=Panicum miliaceum TaxID=4540 RepID=A0A3L6RES1_PANMI|nr:hypothetical protein C2845_PM13G02410 [Panicum miliaceum]